MQSAPAAKPTSTSTATTIATGTAAPVSVSGLIIGGNGNKTLRAKASFVVASWLEAGLKARMNMISWPSATTARITTNHGFNVFHSPDETMKGRTPISAVASPAPQAAQA